MRHLMDLISVGLLSSAAWACAEQAPDPTVKIDPLIVQLDSEQFETREAAFKQLVAIGTPAVPAVRKALEVRNDSPELAAKARRFLELFDGGGETVNGLKITLKADKATLKPGEAITFTALLANMTDKPLKVYVGYSTSGVRFESGAAFRRLELVQEGGLEKLKPHEPVWRVGFCGTGAYPLFETIPALSTKTYACESVFDQRPWDSKGRLEQAPQNPGFSLGKERHCHMPTTASNTHRLGLYLKAEDADYRTRGFRGIKGDDKPNPKDPSLGEWTGEIRSNEVNITTQ